jgi:hypothetical protein
MNRAGAARTPAAVPSAVGTRAPRVGPRWDSAIRAAAAAAAGLGAVALSLFASERLAPQSLFVSLALAVLVVLPVWLVLSTNYAVTLAALLLYLGLVDGVLKLKLNTPTAALGRDVVLYSIVFGAGLRLLSSRRPLRLPPITGYVAAFTAIALAEVMNPGSQSLAHGLAALRPHVEFVPLFFFGYAVMRSRHRLRAFLVLLCVVAAANGVAGLVQFNQAPDQLAAWGPGYADRIAGVGVSGRTFADKSDTNRVRPFALGSDAGFGGFTGALAVPAVLALLATGRRRWRLLVGPPFAAGIILAVVTSQSRSAVLAAVAAGIAFVALAMTSQRRAPTLFGVAAVLALAVGVISVVTAGQNGAALSRYESIAPARVLTSTFDYRKGTLAAIPEYATSFPLGKGLGLVGPAAGFGVTFDRANALNGESQFTFLLVELGVAGLLVFGALQIKLLALAARLPRIRDSELRLLLAACTAPLFAIAASWISGPVSASSPTAPFIWFTAGALAFWLIEQPAQRRRPHDRGGAPG